MGFADAAKTDDDEEKKKDDDEEEPGTSGKGITVPQSEGPGSQHIGGLIKGFMSLI